MPRRMPKYERDLASQYPPSDPCTCETCWQYCSRPGWWTVREAETAMEAGLRDRMMLEISPERTFGVLSPAFKGCERCFALQRFADRGCTFLQSNLCELHGSGFQPLECRFCHHDRRGQGPHCHAALENNWHSPAGRTLVRKWIRQVGLSADLKLHGRSRIMASGL